jgi:hypothetical protein
MFRKIQQTSTDGIHQQPDCSLLNKSPSNPFDAAHLSDSLLRALWSHIWHCRLRLECDTHFPMRPVLHFSFPHRPRPLSLLRLYPADLVVPAATVYWTSTWVSKAYGRSVSVFLPSSVSLHMLTSLVSQVMEPIRTTISLSNFVVDCFENTPGTRGARVGFDIA